MKRLIIIALLFVTATVFAAGKQYYDYPDATVFKNTDRMLIYQNASGSKNLTGAGLKNVISQTAWDPRYPRVFQEISSASNPSVVSYIRDRRGVIQGMTGSNGGQFKGIPGYNHTYVYPFNGMTNVSRSTPLVIGSCWLTRGVIGKNISLNGGPALTIKGLFYGGLVNGLPNFGFVNESVSNQSMVDAFYWGTNSVGTLAANTTYTIRSAMPASWGGTNGLYSPGMDPCTYTLANTSSAKVMSNYSSQLCRSTFRTGSI